MKLLLILGGLYFIGLIIYFLFGGNMKNKSEKTDYNLNGHQDLSGDVWYMDSDGKIKVIEKSKIK